MIDSQTAPNGGSRSVDEPGVGSYSVTEVPGGWRFDIGPSGFSRPHGMFVAGWWICASLLFALGGAGITLGITAHDFGVPLRIFISIAGTVGVVASLVPFGWALAHAWFLRTSVVIRGSGVVIRTGFPWRSRVSTAPAEGTRRIVDSQEPLKGLRQLLHGKGALLLQAGSWSEPLAALFPDSGRASLRDAMTSHLAGSTGTPADAADAVAPPPPLPWGVRGYLRSLGASLGAPFRQPVGFLLFDGLTLGAAWVVTYLVEAVPLSLAYPIAFVAYLVGLALRLGDRRYLAGLDESVRAFFQLPALFVLAAAVLGLSGGFSLRVVGPVLVTTVAGLVASIALHVMLVRRRRPAPRGTGPGAARRIVQFACVWPLASLHEHLMFGFFDNTSDLFVLALPMVVPVVMFLYLPVRMHYFIEAPRDRSNWLWFGITVMSLSLYGVLGVALF